MDLIEKDYNSLARQNRVKNYLNGLLVSDSTNSTIDAAAVISKLYKVIFKLSRQVPISYDGDSHRLAFLRREFLGHPWAIGPLSRAITHTLSFQALYGELKSLV